MNNNTKATIILLVVLVISLSVLTIGILMIVRAFNLDLPIIPDIKTIGTGNSIFSPWVQYHHIFNILLGIGITICIVDIPASIGIVAVLWTAYNVFETAYNVDED